MLAGSTKGLSPCLTGSYRERAKPWCSMLCAAPEPVNPCACRQNQRKVGMASVHVWVLTYHAHTRVLLPSAKKTPHLERLIDCSAVRSRAAQAQRTEPQELPIRRPEWIQTRAQGRLQTATVISRQGDRRQRISRSDHSRRVVSVGE